MPLALLALTAAAAPVTPTPWPSDTPLVYTFAYSMTCHEPGLGEVWMVWGPGRELVELDIDEESSDLGSDASTHRTAIFAGALELWPEVPRVGGTWAQRGRFGVLKVAPNTGSSSFELTHTTASVDGDRVQVTDAGAGTMLAGSGADLAARVSLVAEGTATFDTTRGLLLERKVRVFPTHVTGISYGTMGHEVTVRLEE